MKIILIFISFFCVSPAFAGQGSVIINNRIPPNCSDEDMFVQSQKKDRMIELEKNKVRYEDNLIKTEKYFGRLNDNLNNLFPLPKKK